MSTHRLYRQGLFKPTALLSAEDVDNALLELGVTLDEANILDLLEQVMQQETNATLALILANIPDGLVLSLLNRYPNDASMYVNGVYDRLMQNLAAVFVFLLPATADREMNRAFLANHSTVHTATFVLNALATFTPPKLCNGFEDTEENIPFRRGKISQKKLKRSKRFGASLPAVDLKHYDALDIDEPLIAADVPETILLILEKLRALLSFYLDYLQEPDVLSFLKAQAVFVPEQNVEEVSSQLKQQPESIESSELPSAYPMVRPMKSALHFDSPDGFGAWKIIIGKNAHDALRSTHRKDLATFEIIIRKIKDLSTGHFSGDNQKRLSGGVSSDVAVYEAKMSRDLRLVYQIDLIPSDDEHEQQAVKIFGIYTHAQMDHRLWASISSQLRKRGQVYRDRCAVRRRSDHADTDMFVPAIFPPLSEISSSDVENLPDLLPNDTAQVHSRLVVEKFVTFSQPFLNSVMADLDVTLPHLVSSQEKKIIENPTSCYVIGRSGTGKTTTMLFKMLLIERTYHLMGENVSRPRQVFVTKSRMLAKKVQEYFKKLASSLSHASQTLAELRELNCTTTHDDMDGEDHLVDVDDETDWRVDLPKRFSDLEDRHFPLFITYDGLCDLLEGDLAGKAEIRRNSTSAELITFETFLSSYWGHFSETIRKGLDPALVYSEIIGVIKGSEESLSHEKRYLSSDVYTKLSERQHSTLAGRTEEVYTLFQTYMRMKKTNVEYDVADRTHKLLRFFENHGVPGRSIDHLYIDEVQDNLLIDTMVLRALCSNSHGLFWAGDTAQTISVGSSFRFDGLKAFQFRLETQHQKKQKHGVPMRVEDPELFQLAINYRSHAGIVDCAHSVIDLISLFWSDSIDRLSPEVGIVDGFKPVFFSNENREQLEHFIFGDVGSHIEFGAQQCILVRSEAAKERLLKQVGEVGLVLTIYESKGLEFNDVLLYDFFSDSVVGASAWRVVLNAVEGTNIPAPTFDKIRHASVCTELKSLYVAITRARENVWIADSSEEGRSMRTYWTSRNLVQDFAPGKDAPQLATSSTAEEWAAQGRELFNQKRYGPAKHCYTRAKIPKLAAVAGAYYSRQKARSIAKVKQTLSDRRLAFRAAADAFFDCAAAETTESVKTTYLRNSAKCFEEANDLERAAYVYRLAKDFNRSGELYRDLKKFDEAVDIVEAEEDQMRPDIVNSIIKRARLAYFDAQDIEKGCRLFDSTDDALEYLEDRGLDIARADILLSLGEIAAAAELHYAEGRREIAISLFLRCRDVPSLRRGVQCIIEGLWQHCSFAVPPNVVKTNGAAQELLAFIPTINTAILSPSDSEQLSMFRAISSNSQDELMGMGLRYSQANDYAAALLCLDHVFAWRLKIESAPLPEVIDKLTKFTVYVALFSKVAFQMDPTKDEFIARLFGFSRIAENTILVPTWATFLHDAISREKSTLRAPDFHIAVADFQAHFRKALSARLRKFAETANEVCLHSKAFSPCLSFVVFGSCPRHNCPENHIHAKDIGPAFYNQRVHVHLLQMLIVQSLRETSSKEEDDHRSFKYLISRLYNALYPPHISLGSISKLDLLSMPEAEKGLNLMRHWVQSLAYTQSFHPQTHFLTNIITISSLAFTFDRQRALATKYLYLAPYWGDRPPSRYTKFGVFIIGDLLASMAGSTLGGGTLSLRHVLEKRLPINVPVLCNRLDFLWSSYVLCGRAKVSNFHDITLPKSWLLKYFLWDAEHFGPKMQTNNYLPLVNCMAGVLENLYTGGDLADYLLYGTSKTMRTLPATTRNVFIARIIQSLCLLGYNIQNSVLRECVRNVVSSLKKAGRPFPPLYREYIEASNNWDGLARVARRSLDNSSADEMIHLLEKKKMKRQVVLKGVRQVIFNKPDDIVSLLCGKTQSAPQEAESVQENTSQLTAAPSLPLIVDDEPGQDDSDGAADSSDDEPEEQVVIERLPPTPEEQAAATTIQKAYRRLLIRRKGLSKSGIAGTVNQIYAACLNVPAWDPSYRYMLRGPLVHVLVCLDFAKTDSLGHKNRTKEQLKSAQSAEMEQLDDLLTQTNQAHKAIVGLQKALQPSAKIHMACEKGELYKLVRRAKDVLCSLPFTPSSDLSLHLMLGVKGILTPRVVRVRHEKPSLNMDDDDY